MGLLWPKGKDLHLALLNLLPLVLAQWSSLSRSCTCHVKALEMICSMILCHIFNFKSTWTPLVSQACWKKIGSCSLSSSAGCLSTFGVSHPSPQTCGCVNGVSGHWPFFFWIVGVFFCSSSLSSSSGCSVPWGWLVFLVKTEPKKALTTTSTVSSFFVTIFPLYPMEVLSSSPFGVSIFRETFFIVFHGSRQVKF